MMVGFLNKWRILWVCIYWLITFVPNNALASDCVRKFVLMASGVPTLVERSAHDLISLPLSLLGAKLGLIQNPREVTDSDRNVRFGLTGRGPLEYLDLAGLYTTDLKGKKILDVASGNGRFVHEIGKHPIVND
jgi:hypothetical protein